MEPMPGHERPHGVRHPLRLPVGLALLVVASACGTTSDGAASPSTTLEPAPTSSSTGGTTTDPDRPLAGTSWVADTLMTDDAFSTLPQGATATLAIADGLAAVSTGCNSGSAPVTITGDVLTFGPMTLTEIGCDGDAAALEQIVVSTLRGELTVTIEAGWMTLVHADGSGLRFTAAP